MNSLIAMLCIIINGSFVKDTDYRIALFILEHIHDMRSYSISAIASSCLTSPATVKKFFRMFGHTSYSQFLFQIDNSLEIRRKQMEERNSHTDLNHLIQMMLSVYPTLDSAVLLEKIKEINTSVHESRRTVILGAYYPGALAVNYQEDMILMGKSILIVPVIPSLLNDLEEVTEDDFIIMATISGSLYTLNPLRENALKKYPKTAIITAENTDTSSFKDAIEIKLPQTEDNEMYNYFLALFWQILKNDYSNTYAKLQ